MQTTSLCIFLQETLNALLKLLVPGYCGIMQSFSGKKISRFEIPSYTLNMYNPNYKNITSTTIAKKNVMTP